MPGSSTEAVLDAVRQTFGADARAGEPALLAGGAMHDSWAVDVDDGGATRRLVARISPAGRVDHEKTRREFAVLRVAFAHGVRCPEALAVGMCATGDDYLLMTHEAGETNPRAIIAGERYADARPRLIPQFAENLARIHAISLEEVAEAPGIQRPPAGMDALAAMRRTVEDAYRRDLLDPHPAIEWAFRWIDRTIAALEPSAAVTLVHGDFRMGNILCDEEGLSSLLDWEGTHISEPEEDLAWFCTWVWRFGSELPAGGIAPREEWLRSYEEASGRAVSRARVAAWEVLQNIRWAQITMMQARAHLDGHANSHELAAIGRRTAETELEILRLAGVGKRAAHAG